MMLLQDTVYIIALCRRRRTCMQQYETKEEFTEKWRKYISFLKALLQTQICVSFHFGNFSVLALLVFMQRKHGGRIHLHFPLHSWTFLLQRLFRGQLNFLFKRVTSPFSPLFLFVSLHISHRTCFGKYWKNKTPLSECISCVLSSGLRRIYCRL